jgi:UDP-N-acetyl-D-mannosaminuronic acid transferase (WecB/TagA/CpsF family)
MGTSLWSEVSQQTTKSATPIFCLEGALERSLERARLTWQMKIPAIKTWVSDVGFVSVQFDDRRVIAKEFVAVQRRESIFDSLRRRLGL